MLLSRFCELNPFSRRRKSGKSGKGRKGLNRGSWRAYQELVTRSSCRLLSFSLIGNCGYIM